MSAQNHVIINAYVARYSKAQLESFLDQALENYANGVIVTDLSFEGGSTSGQLTGNTQTLIEIFAQCLALKEEGATAQPRQAFIPAAFPAGG